jgi:hypothetical protein
VERSAKFSLNRYLCLAVVCGLLYYGPATRAESGTIDQAVTRAMAWIEANPASLSETGLLEVVEELIAFYVLNNHSTDPAERAAYFVQVQKRQGLLVPYNESNAKTRLYRDDPFAPVEYVLAAQIMKSFGMDTASYRVIIDDMVSTPALLDSAPVSMQLWTHLYLQRLGYAPAVSIEDLVKRSTLATEPHTQALLRDLTANRSAGYDAAPVVRALYDMTHQVFALTDFGALPPPALISGQRAYCGRLFDEAIAWASNAESIDILAELVVCARLLGLDEVPALPHALNVLIDQQLEDGSFGVTKPDRPNVYRHGVLTSIAALSLARPRTEQP